VALPTRARLPGRAAQGLRRPRQLRARLREQLIFPEIVYDKIDKVRGMDISIVTTARTDEDAKVLLTHLGMPVQGVAFAWPRPRSS